MLVRRVDTKGYSQVGDNRRRVHNWTRGEWQRGMLPANPRDKKSLPAASSENGSAAGIGQSANTQYCPRCDSLLIEKSLYSYCEECGWRTDGAGEYRCAG